MSSATALTGQPSTQDIMLLEGDCLASLRGLADASVDSVCTDPPYGLAFMGRAWDRGGPDQIAFTVEFWSEVFRVLKPGGHLVAFSGTRTYHRMVCAIEDAGFEIRDQLGWVYGTGFPKSLDISKGIDKAAGAEREIISERKTGWQGTLGGKGALSGLGEAEDVRRVTAPATAEARQWQGWGTALKPAWEPIVLARKPLIGTVVENVLAHGTGGLNIDACRIGFASAADEQETKQKNQHGDFGSGQRGNRIYGADTNDRTNYSATGRWPANILHDGSDEVETAFAAFGESKSSVGLRGIQGRHDVSDPTAFRPKTGTNTVRGHADAGSASRFFYCAKASKTDRAGSKHPTVKPIALMRWLVRLVTPPGGTVLDPFAGSGTTGQAAREEGFGVVLCEREAEFIADIRRRLGLPNLSIVAADTGVQVDIFDGLFGEVFAAPAEDIFA